MQTTNATPARRVLFWIAAGTLFALAYGQSPPFTNNGNTKLLHGMAAAGWGDLRHDWLANTPDPFPAFNAVVYVVTKLGYPALFHLIYAVLLGVYLYGGWRIAAWLRPRGGTLYRALFVALMVLAHALTTREMWDGVGMTLAGFPPGLAGQFLLGPVFEPAVFGALIPLSVALFLRDKPAPAGALLGVAAAMHPTYLLGTAALAVTYAAWWLTRRPLRWRPALVTVAAFLAVAGPELAYLAFRFGGGDPEVARQANDILIQFRIPHHSLPSLFMREPEVWLVLPLIPLGIWLSRGALRFVLLWPTLGAAALTLLAVAIGPTVLNLIAPWRMSTFLTALALIVVLARAAEAVATRLEATPRRRFVHVTAAVVVCVLAADGVRVFARDYRRLGRQKQAAVIRHVVATRRPGEQYLVPPFLTDFRLRSGAATYVTRRANPIAGRAVLAWYDRLLRAEAVYVGDAAADAQLRGEGVTHVVMETSDEAAALPALEAAVPGCRVIWRDANYLLVALGEP